MKPDSRLHAALIAQRAEEHPPLVIPPELAELVTCNTIQMLIKLARYKFIARLLKRTDTVLEVGSGTGIGSIFISQHTKYVTGVEPGIADFEAAKAMNRRDNVEFQNDSIFDFCPNTAFDAVIAVDVIEHFDINDGRRLLVAMQKNCKPDGVIIVGSPSVYSFPYQGANSQAAHIHCYDQAELVALMDEMFSRTFVFSMNDEIVHTGHPKMAWYYFAVGVIPKSQSALALKEG